MVPGGHGGLAPLTPAPGRSVTRGHGLLEGFLARQRTRRANALIPEQSRGGRLLDIGCGTYPLFLLNTRFAERYGLDREVPSDLIEPGLVLRSHDVAVSDHLPFDSEYFDVVTMLAVFEHLDRPVLTRLLGDILRVLKPGGMFVMTTPAGWTDRLLKAMGRFGLVSREEVDEHRGTYSHAQIVAVAESAGFDRALIRYGSFEAGLNLWLTARRTPSAPRSTPGS
ncbi:MAG TPA: class I SAM-dependent methyltransferase [Candidatus Dormibacteraeota bacterium]|nr:class I SAM-dependent methyltransferase [Candidatus Dormibacteraeota bacterium]